MDGILFILNQTGMALAQAQAEIERLNAELASHRNLAQEQHAIAGQEWSWSAAGHVLSCDQCESWRLQASEWVNKQVAKGSN